MNKTSFHVLLIVAALMRTCTSSHCQTNKTPSRDWTSGIEDHATARKYFVEMERVARLPKAEQQKEVPHVYRDLFPALERRMYSNYIPRDQVQRLLNRADLTPEQLAETVDAGGWFLLQEAGWFRGAELLQEHRATLLPVVKADLQSADENAIRRAIRATSTLQLKELFQELLTVFRANEQFTSVAAYALRDLDDPHAIAALVERYPDRPMEFYELLLHLSRKRKADPALVGLLDANDGQVRWRAAYALRESGDPALEPQVRKLVKDRESQVRQHAAVIAFNLPADVFARLRPELLSLLKDSNPMVRWQAALCFAERKDRVSAKTLHDLLADQALDESYNSYVVQSIHTLTGSYFGYELSQPPHSEANKSALERFNAWIGK